MIINNPLEYLKKEIHRLEKDSITRAIRSIKAGTTKEDLKVMQRRRIARRAMDRAKDRIVSEAIAEYFKIMEKNNACQSSKR
jgi:hypothetical protein